MRTIYLLSLFLTMLTLGSASCEGPAGCQPPLNGTYEFEIPVQLSPARDTFRVGDTITIRSRFSHDVWERTTGRTFELRDWKFYTGARLADIGKDTALQDAWNQFTLHIDTNKYGYSLHTFTTGSIALLGDYLYMDSVYSVEFDMMPQSPGLYLFWFGSNVWHFERNQYFEDKCRSDDSEVFALMNDGADNNAHLLAASPDPHYNNWVTSRLKERFYDRGGYCFVVVE